MQQFIVDYWIIWGVIVVLGLGYHFAQSAQLPGRQQDALKQDLRHFGVMTLTLISSALLIVAVRAGAVV